MIEGEHRVTRSSKPVDPMWKTRQGLKACSELHAMPLGQSAKRTDRKGKMSASYLCHVEYALASLSYRELNAPF